MSEPGARPPVPPQPPRLRPSRLRRFFLRHLPLTLASAALLLALAAVGLYLWASSAGFETMVRKRLVTLVEQSTGGRVEIASFHWRLLHLQAEAGGLVIHGLEAPDEAPYASIERLQVKLSVLGLLSPRLQLSDLEILHPGFHLIVYRDGSTNQPHPRKPRKPGKPLSGVLLDAKAAHVSLQDGSVTIENRATAFDFQNRFALLYFDANDVSLIIDYVPPAASIPESYRIEASAADLNLSRGAPKPAHGSSITATLDLTRAAIYLRSLRIASRGSVGEEHSLRLSGELDDFAHPRWQARAMGEMDMRFLDQAVGFPFVRGGVARLDLAGEGEAGEFRVDGGVHIDGGSYRAPGVTASDVNGDAHIHADAKQLLITSIVAHLRQGGQLEGTVALDNWLPPVPGGATLQAQEAAPARAPAHRNPAPPVHRQPLIIPVNGKVTGELKDVALDTILDMVGQPPLQRVGLDARLNGPATATWSNGDARTVVVGATLAVDTRGQPEPGEVPVSGFLDATYTQRDGSVDLRKCNLHMPASSLEAHGKLGAYPVSSPTALAIDLHSRNLFEFDILLRRLGLKRNGKTGTAALPVTLAGQADFHGTWTGSLVDPRIAGALKASQLAIEIAPASNGNPGQAELSRWDTVEVTGSYSARQIAISNGLLRRGMSEIALDGTLVPATEEVAPGKLHSPRFGANSLLHLRLRAGKVGGDELLPLVGQDLPQDVQLTGSLDAQLQVDGRVRALAGSGWVELDGATVYGEPVARIRAQGSMANRIVKLASLNVSAAAGHIAATGSLDLGTHRFQVDASGSGIDAARIEWLRRHGIAVAGRLGFSLLGSGTPQDPRLEARATLTSFFLGEESLGSLKLVAHTAANSVQYDAATTLVGAELALHGETALHGDNATQARLDFSRFDIGALLKMARIQGLSGESALAGVVTVDGPLARPKQLRGDARLQQMEVTVDGVHLVSQGGVHATLANALVNLDPLHITGEETDLRVQASLSLQDERQLDVAASGSINLKLAQTLDPDLTASGASTFQVEAHGPLDNPAMQGRIDFQNGSLSLEDVPNGLSQLRGALVFNQHRLEVSSLTAMSGGGLLAVSGYLAYRHGIFADLSVTGKGIRIRYPPGVSSLADATLRLQGSQNNLLLAGDVLITRFSVSPDLDIAALAAQAGGIPTIAPPDAPSNHIRLDVHLASSPQLSFQNAYAKLAGDVDLRLRGTVASPSLLGRVSITEGNAMIAGTRYELQHGDIFFTNPVRIEPSIDLNATAHVEDYDITLALRGTPDKLAVTYRSDPPLPEADVVALLALGRTENQQRIYTQQQEQALNNPSTDALLGGALNATVSSRVQKLFGAGSVKVDPNYLGTLGNSTSRIIVEEQLGRDLTLTYATNVDTTSHQLIQAEVAINRHVSLLVARDESGVFSMVVKATRRYR